MRRRVGRWTRKLASVPGSLNPVNSTHVRTAKGAQGAEVEQAEGAANGRRQKVESGAARRVVDDGAGRLSRAHGGWASCGGSHATVGEERRTLGRRGANRRRCDSQL